jgi:large subunit ribosomal protein L10
MPAEIAHPGAHSARRGVKPSPRRLSSGAVFLFGAHESISLKGRWNPMARPEKEASIAELKKDLQNCAVAIMSKYQGITVDEVTSLRASLRAERIKFKVYKNTLARRALDELQLSEAAAFMEGPTVWAFSSDPVAPARVLKKFGKDVPAIQMRGGILEGKPVDAAMLEALADLPPRDQLIALVVGVFAAPLRNFLGTLQAVPRNFLGVLDAVKKKQEEGAAA